jgi:hypothetical protein
LSRAVGKLFPGRLRGIPWDRQVDGKELRSIDTSVVTAADVELGGGSCKGGGDCGEGFEGSGGRALCLDKVGVLCKAEEEEEKCGEEKVWGGFPPGGRVEWLGNHEKRGRGESVRMR